MKRKGDGKIRRMNVLRTVVERNRDEKDEDGGYVQRHVEAESMFIGRKGKVLFLEVLLLSFLSF